MNIQKHSENVHSICHQWCIERQTIAFVPTMGNLHAGHLKLVEKAQQLADKIVVSIFVNPLQFGENEDYSVYPRTIDEDREKLADHVVDLLFVPEVHDIYPNAPSESTIVEVPTLSGILCGASRPRHFSGVATVVNKFFNIIQPNIAVFGKKDFQQLMIIKRMVNDLNMPLTIVGEETIREQDGLATSSRNAYLTTDERERAPLLFHSLSKAKQRILSGDKQFTDIEDAMKLTLNQQKLTTEYFSIRNATDLIVADVNTKDFVVLAAVYLGSTRLIDNLSFSLK